VLILRGQTDSDVHAEGVLGLEDIVRPGLAEENGAVSIAVSIERGKGAVDGLRVDGILIT